MASVWWVGIWGMIFMVSTDLSATAAIPGVSWYISSVLNFHFFSFCCLILTNCGIFWHPSIFRAPVTKKEKLSAGSRGGPCCLAGQKQQEQQEHNKTTNCYIPNPFLGGCHLFNIKIFLRCNERIKKNKTKYLILWSLCLLTVFILCRINLPLPRNCYSIWPG